MPAATCFRNTQPNLGHANVDAASGIIREASVITTGEARGHGVFIDATTLAQVKCCAETFRGGLGVKFNPDTFNHGEAGYAGSLQNLRIIGNRLVGDIYLLETYQGRDYLLELAARQPDSFGLSIDFEMYGEEIGGKTFARCAKIDAVTVVDAPAANSGLFRVGPARAAGLSPSVLSIFTKSATTTQNTHMNQTTFAKTATGFAARIAHFQATGKSRGRAILDARAADRQGFNAWCKESRPGEAPSEQNPIAHGMKGFRITGC